MVQDQLVDYISSQMKLGVSRDAIRSALVSAGWVAADVDDTFKKVEGGAKAQPVVIAASTTMAKPASMGSSMGGASSIGGAAKTGESQMIRVSDLVSSSPAMATGVAAGAAVGGMAAAGAKINKDASFGGKISGNTFQTTSTSSKTGKNSSMLIGGIVAVVLILGLGGAAWYFYSGNAALAAQVASLTSQTTSVNTQLTSLRSQVDASSTELNAQIALLTSTNSDLALNLSFYAAPPGSSSTSTSPITVSGLLSGGGKAPYALTTSYGAKIFVANSTDAVIGPQLKSSVGQTVQLTGTYMPGSDQLTASSVATSSAQ